MTELVNQNDVLAVATQTGTMLTLAGSLVKSGLIPNAIKTPEAALGILLKGRELGLAPMQSFDSIDVIQGKPTLKPQAMLALIYSSTAFSSFEITHSDDESCTVMMQRRGGRPHSETFTMADAKAQGLSTKDNWKKQPATMLKWRAVSACARVVFPDVIQGMYTPEEIGQDLPQVEVELLGAPPEPERGEAPGAAMVTPAQVVALSIALKEAGFKPTKPDKERGRAYLAWMVGRDSLESVKDLTREEAGGILDRLGTSDDEAGSYRVDMDALQDSVQAWVDEQEMEMDRIGEDEALEELPA